MFRKRKRLQEQTSRRRYRETRRKRLLIEALERRRLLAIVNWTGGGDGTSFLSPLNWDTAVPTAGDDAVINVTNGNPTITVSGDASVNSLVTQEAITFNNGATFAVATTAEVNAAATISGATIVGAHFTGTGTLQVTSADGTLDGVTLGVDTTLLNGAVVTVTGGLTLDNSTLLLNRSSSSGSTSDHINLNFSGGVQTLGGNGVVELYNNVGNANEIYLRLRPTDGGDLTIGPGITIQDTSNSYFTALGDSTLPLAIQGKVISQSTRTAANGLRVTGSSVTIDGGTLQVNSSELDVNNLSGDVGNTIINGGDLDLDGTYSFDQPVNVLSGSLTLRGAWTNNSTITQSGGVISLGGTFQVADLGTLNGTAGTVSIFGTLDDGGATLPVDSERTWQLSGGTIRGVTVADNGNGGALGTFQVTSADGTLDGVTLGVDTTLLNGAVVTVTGGLTLDNSTLLLNRSSSSGSTSDHINLNFSGGVQTLGGNGVVELYNNVGNANEIYLRLRPTDGGDLTIGPGITIQDTSNSYFTALGDSTLPLAIQGKVISQSTRTAANGLRVTGSSVTIDGGTLQANSSVLDVNNLSGDVGNTIINGGDLDLDGTYSFDQPVNVLSGILTLRGDWTNNSTITQSGGVISLGGTFQVADLGTFTGTSGTVSIFGTLDDGGATLPVDSERTWQLSGGTIRGVTVADNGNGGALGTFQVTSADGTLDGVTLGVDTTLLSGAVVTVTGGLTLDNSTLLLNRSSNSGSTSDHINLNFSGGVQTLGGNGVVELYNNYGNANEVYLRLRPTNGGDLTIGPGITIQDTSNSYFTALGDSTLPLTIQGKVISQSTRTSANGLRVTGSSVTIDGGTLMATSSVLDLPTAPTNFSSGMLTGGTWHVTGGGTIQIPAGNEVNSLAATVIAEGVPAILKTGTVDSIAGLTAITSVGSLTIGNGRDFTTQGAFSNDGNLTVEAGSTFTVPSSQTYTATGTTTVNGSFHADAVTLSGGAELVGRGDVVAPVTATAGTSIAPGNSPGILNVGDLDLQSGAMLAIEIGGPLVGTDYDQLNVTGTVTLAGDLQVVLLNAYEPPSLQPFTIINNDGADAVIGNFDGLPEGSKVIVGPTEFFITYEGGDGNDVVLGAAPPIVNWDGGGDGTSWQQAANWEGDVLPTAFEQAVINVSGSNPTIVVASDVHVYSLVTNEAVQFTGGTFTTTATAEINAAATLAGGTLADTRLIGTGTLSLTSIDGSGGNASDGMLDGVTLGIDTTVEDGAQITVVNDLMLSGGSTLRLARTSGSSTAGFDVGLNFDGLNPTLGGSGVVELFNNRNAVGESQTRIRSTADTLTIGAGITVQNDPNSYFTTIGDPNKPLVIEGTIVSQTTRPAYTSNGLRLVGSGVTNAGTLAVTSGLLEVADSIVNDGSVNVSGGELLLADSWTNRAPGTIDQSGGTISLGGTFAVSNLGNFTGSGGTVSIVGSLNDPGETLMVTSERTWQLGSGGELIGLTIADDNDGDAAGTFQLASGSATLEGVTLAVDTTLLNGAKVDVKGNLTLAGVTLDLTRTSTLVSLDNDVQLNFVNGANQRLDGVGVVEMYNARSSPDVNPFVRIASTNGGGLTIGSNIALQNRSDSFFTILGDSGSTLAIEGTVLSQSTRTQYGRLLATGSTVTNNGGTLTSTAGVLDVVNFSGDVGDVVASGGTVDLDGTFSVNQPLTLSGTLDLDGSYSIDARIDVASGNLYLRGDWINHNTIDQTGGTVHLGDSFVISDFGTLTGTAGTVSIFGTLTDPGNTLLVDADRTWQLDGGTLSQVTVDGEAGAALQVTSADGTLDRVTLSVDTTLLTGSQVTVNGDLTLDNVTVKLQRVSSFTGSSDDVRLNFVDTGNQRVNGTGVVEMYNSLNSPNSNPWVRVASTGSGSLTIGPQVTIQNRSDSFETMLGDPGRSLTIEGKVFSQTTKTQRNRLLVTGSTVINSGGTLQSNAGVLDVVNFSGDVGDVVASGGTVDLDGTFSVNQPLTLSGTLDLDGSYSIDARIDVASGNLYLRGDWINHNTIDQTGGTVHLGDSFVISDFGTLTGTAGTVSIFGTLTDPGNTLLVDADRTWQLDGGTLSQVTVDGETGAVLQVTAADGTLDRVTLSVDTTLLTGSQVTVNGDLTLDNVTVKLQRVSTFTGSSDNVGLNFVETGSQRVDGTGVVEMYNSLNSPNSSPWVRVASTGSGNLTIGPQVTIQNRSDSYTTLLGDTSSSLTIEGTVLSQTTKTQRNNLLVTGSTVTNSGGTLQSNAGVLDVVNFSGNVGDAVASGGTVDLDGTFSVNQPLTLSGTLDLDGSYSIDARVDVGSGNLYLRGDWINHNTIDQTGGTVHLGDTFVISDMGTLTGTAGTVAIFGTLADPGNTLLVDADRTWQLDGGTLSQVTVDGEAGASFAVTSADGTLDRVTLAVDTTLLNGAQVNVNGDLLLDDITLRLNRSALTTIPTNDVGLNFTDSAAQRLDGTGVVEMFNALNTPTANPWVRIASTSGASGGSLTIGSGITVQNRAESYATILGEPGAPLTIEGTVLGQTTKTQNSNLSVTGSSITNNGTLKSISGLLNVASTPTNFSPGTISGGTWHASGSGDIRVPAGNELTTIAADVILDGADAFLQTGAGVDSIAGITSIAAGGSLTLEGGHDFTTIGDFDNDGALTVGSGTSFTVPNGNGFVTRGTTIVNGALTSDSITVAGGTLGGSGVVAGPIVTTASGTVAPGNSPGILNVNDFDLQAGGTLNIETGGSVAGTDYDQLNVAGTVTLAGDLDIDVFSSIVKGTTFTIINNDGGDAIVGIFDGVPEGSVFDNGYDEYLVTYVGGDGNDVVLTALTDVRAVTNTNDAGVGSLRDEMTVANGIAGDVAVIFRIPGAGPFTITPASALPGVNNRLFIDATTQDTFAGVPVVEISGAAAGPSTGFDFIVNSDGSLLRGLAIHSFESDGVYIEEADEILIAGNYIGTDLSGSIDLGNGRDGIFIVRSQGSVIGGPNAEDRNVISGNDEFGIRLASDANDTQIEGNYIGLDASGTADLGNTNAGVGLQTLFGPADRPPVGNFIGVVGGAPNVISGNDLQGVIIQDGSTGNTVVNNYIGLTADGTGLVSNVDNAIGVFASNGNQIGLAGAGNVIAGSGPDALINVGLAVGATATGNQIQGNVLGTDVGGTVTLGGTQGIRVNAPGNLVGGKSFGDGNTIRGMLDEGVLSVPGNQILGNSIFDNGQRVGFDPLGIDIGLLGVTLTNVPAIDLAVAGVSTTRVGGTLTATPGTKYRIEVFSSSAASSSGYGEGETYLGFVNVTTDSTGFARFNFATSTLVAPGESLSATATSESEGTSEFALSVAARPSIVVTSTNDFGAGTLRQAIIDANAAGGGDVIEFDIAGAGPHTLAPTIPMPGISDRTVIDGRSEPDFAGSPVLELDGTATTGTAISFLAGSDGSQVFGLAIGGFGIGVRASVADVTIAGNYLGLDASGTVGNGNTYGVQLLDAPRAQVGGAAAADRNVISANTSNGVLVSGAGSAGVRVQGNLVGLSADEASAIGNVVGISISTSASDSFVGTDGDGVGDATEGNVVAGNSNRGIVIDGASNVMVAGNKVGVASDGMTEFANASGVATVASATNFLIGTNGDGISDRLERNLITGNTGNGITLQDSSGGIVAGNLVIGNGNDGLLIFSASGVTVGGPLASQRNVFSDNDSGVVVDGAAATGNKIFGNYIGLDETGLNPLPNTFGVLFTSDAIGNFLGTDGDGVNDEREGNVIASNTAYDIEISPTATGNNNVIAGNYVGTDATGLVSLSDTSVQVLLQAGARVGTNADGISDLEERNIFAGTVQLGTLGSRSFSGNYLGVGPDGSTLLGSPSLIVNGGVLEQIGGSAAVQRNVFAGLVDFENADSKDFRGNYVGVLPDGVTPIPGSYLWIRNGSQNNAIGQAGSGSGNVISRVHVSGTGTSGNSFENNLIGTNADGSDGLGINEIAFLIDSGASNNAIGTLSAGNVISTVRSDMAQPGSNMHGVVIEGSSTTFNSLARNRIGLDSTGTKVIGNQTGVLIRDGVPFAFVGRGNVISGNVLGVHVSDSVNVRISENLIGLDATGQVDLGNQTQGIFVTGTAVWIEQNVISGNDTGGVLLGDGTLNGVVTDLSVEFNRIGTDITGTEAVANETFGVAIRGSLGENYVFENVIAGNRGPGVIIDSTTVASSGIEVAYNTIGLDVSGARTVPNFVGLQVDHANPLVYDNIISGNQGAGVSITGASGATLRNNIIGLDATGTKSGVGNGGNGVYIVDGRDNLIGGARPTEGNTISANQGDGIRIEGIDSVNNKVSGNRIGTDLTGTLDRGNQQNGISIQDVTPTSPPAGGFATIIGTDLDGSDDDLEGNLLSGNNGSGISIENSAFVSIAGNQIGTGTGGIIPIPNVGDGVSIDSSSVVSVGGLDAFMPNLTANNFGSGVRATGSNSDVQIRGNTISNNGGLGIDLALPGVTVNDPGETDGLQNFPQLDAVQAGSTTIVSGNITSTPNTTLEIDFYASDAPDASNFGEGQRYLGTISLTTDGSGGATFNEVLAAATVGGDFITATATGPTLGTSEFSLFLQATSNAPPTIVQNSLLVTVIDPDNDVATFGIPTLVVNEGDELSLTGDFADVDSSPQVTIYWGDGTTTTDPKIRAESFSARKVYADDDPSESESNIYPVIVRVTDTDGSGSAVIGITVVNVPAAVIDFGLSSKNVSEGQVVTLAGTFTDPGSGDYHFVEIDWGDGSGNQTVAIPRGDRTFAASYRYADDGVYDVGFSLFDDDRSPLLPDPGDIDFAYDFRDRIVVTNVAPSATINAEGNAVEGQTISVSATVNDPGTNDTFSYEWLVRRDGLGVYSSTAAEFTYTPTRDGTYEISLLVSDDDSGEAAAIKTLNVRNDVPSILVDSLVLKANGLAVDFVDEGAQVTLSGLLRDTGSNDLHTITVDFGDGSPLQTSQLELGARSFGGFRHTFVDDPDGPNDNYLITVTASDGADSSSVTLPFEVRNADPSVSIRSDRIIEATVRLVADIQDAGLLDTHTIEWFVNGVQVAGSKVLSVPRPVGGPLDVVFRAIDDDGGIGEVSTTLFVLDDNGNTVNISSTAGQITVDVDGTPHTFTPVDQVLIATVGGDDVVTVDPSVTTNIQVDAGDGNDVVQTAGGNDTLIGGAGADTLISGGGNDVLVSDQGNDRLDGGAGDDEYRFIRFSDKTLIDGAGTDTLNFMEVVEGSGTINGISVDLRIDDGTQQPVHSTGTIALNGTFENVIGSAYSDQITGNAAQNELFGGPGDDSISGSGGLDTLGGGDGQDTIVGSDGGGESIDGGSGDDTIIGGLGDDDTIFGGPGDDSIEGSGGNDTIDGGVGDDTIIGGASGNESIDGGEGSDTIVGGGGDDTIFGGPGDDSIDGSGGTDTIIGGEGDDTIVGGDGGSESITGGTGDDSIVGGDGDGDTIFGGPGDDSIEGSGGLDTIVGGDGNDSIVGDGDGGDSIDAGEGDDTIIGGSGDGDTIFGGPGDDSIEGSGGNDTIVGGEGNDTIVGGGIGNESIDGGTGDDTILSGGGDDTIFGGPGDDSIEGSGGHDTIDGGSGDDTIIGSDGGNESIEGGSGNDTIVGGAGDGDTIFGGPGDDSIVGSGGADTIVGGDGDDTIIGGADGNESIDGGDGDDTITSGDGAGDTIFGGPGDDSIEGSGGSDTIDGGDGDDTIVGGDGGGDSIDGGDGDDTILGGSGPDDTIFGGPGDDSIVGSGGDDTIAGGDGDDTIIGGADGNESIDGGEGNDSIIGGSGDDDTIFGGPGDDSIEGSGGTDTILGGDGDDSIVGGDSGGESIDGGDGDDTIVAGEGPGDTIFGGPGDDSIEGSGGNDTILGGEGDDTIIGSSDGNESLDGGDGDDSILGGGGDGDTIFGGPGDDSIEGSGGTDTIDGGDGDDSIVGGPGDNESIYGGDGDDTIAGGGGQNDSIFGAAGNDVLILDSLGTKIFGDTDVSQNPPEDDRVLIQADANITISTVGPGNRATLTVDGVLVAELIDVSGALIAGGPGDNLLDASAFNGDVGLIGGAGDDTLLGGTGNDTLVGGLGNDSLSGGGGDDTYQFEGTLDLGSDTIDELPDEASDSLDFFGLAVAVNVDLSLTGTQTVATGFVELNLLNPRSLENVTGTIFPDKLRGNDRNNTLIGGGGLDFVYGGAGDDYLTATRTKYVYLDFESRTDGADHVYTQDERDGIQARVEQDFGGFDVVVGQSPPVDQVYITVRFNDPPVVNGREVPGGASDRIGFRDLERGGTVHVDVNGFLGTGTNKLQPDEQNFIALSSTIASHELAHMLGLRHHDAFGSPGQGIFEDLPASVFLPTYSGPTNAFETADHLIASPASVRTTLTDALHDPYFGEREALKLAFMETGESIYELDNSQKIASINLAGGTYPVQTLGSLPPLAVPNLIANPLANSYGEPLDAAAANVIGSITLDGPTSESDFYSFDAVAGDRVTIELMSYSLRSRIANTLDSLVRVFDSTGNKLGYFGTTLGAFNDDGFEPTDSILIDLPIPADGTYFVEVDTFNFFTDEFATYVPTFDANAFCLANPSHIGCTDTDTGSYELLIYRVAPGTSSAPGNLIVGGAGADTLVSSSGNDTFLADAFDTFAGPRAPASLVINAPPTLEAIADQHVDEYTLLEFTAVGDDPDSIDVLTYSLQPAGGTLPFTDGAMIDPETGEFSWTPSQDGEFEALVIVSDLHGLTATQVVRITVINTDLSVTIDSVSGTFEEGSEVTVNGSAADPTGAATVLTLVYEVLLGNAVVASESGVSLASFAFTPEDEGDYLVRVTVQGDNGESDTTQQTVTITNVLPQFEAGPNETLPTASAGVFGRTINFTDPGSDLWTGSVNFGDGTGDEPLVIDQTPKSFTLNHTFVTDGQYIVTVTLSDQDGVPVSDAFLVTTNLNTPPDAIDDPVSTDEDTSVTFGVLGNDVDDQNNIVPSLTVALTQPSAGSLTNHQDGTFTFNPAGAFESLAVDELTTVTFTYQITDAFGATDSATVTIDVDGVNDAPGVGAAVGATETENAPVFSVDLLDGASDPDTSDILSVSGLTLAAGDGSGVTVAGNSLTIDPSAYNALAFGQSELIIYTYSVVDGHGGSVPQTASITINGVNDAPSVTAAISVATDEDAAGFGINLLQGASDPDTSDTLSVSGLTLTSGDASGITVAANSLTVDPSAYNDLAVGQSELIIYTYSVVDGHGGSVPQTASITINGVNDAPSVTAAISVATDEDAAGFGINLLQGASDPDTSDTLNVSGLTLTSGDASGITVAANSLTVDPSAYNDLALGQSELIIYTYSVVDGHGGSVPQTASITINGENDAPEAVDDSDSTSENTSVVVAVLANDSDPDNDALTVAIVTQPSSGVAALVGDGTIAYLPGGGFVGTDSFIYSVTDPSGSTATATVTIVVNPDRENPVISSVQGPQTGIAGQTLAYFAESLDPTDQLSWEVLDDIGNVLANGTGNNFEYSPTTTGQQTVHVTATANSGGTASATIALSVNSVGVVDGDLYVAGTSGSDVLEIVTTGDGTVLVYRDQQLIGSFDNVTGTIIVNGFDGDDAIEIAKQISAPTIIFGGDGNDSITGGSGPDQINGGAGSDLIYGGNGSDVLIGAGEADIIYGGNGTDWIDGGDGDDLLFGENGKDTLVGGQGADAFFGGRGNDWLMDFDEEDALMDDLGKDLIGNGPSLTPQDDPKPKKK